MQAKIYHLHTLSPLHCGTGQATGIVDLPIARARATQLPMVPGSSLRGVVRTYLEQQPSGEQQAKVLFGPRNVSSSEESFAGTLALSDAQLLLLPIRALNGILCYATSPFVLHRYAYDRKRAGLKELSLPISPRAESAKVTSNSCNLLGEKLVLEDLDLSATPDTCLDIWAKEIAATLYPEEEALRGELTRRMALLPDDIFSYLAETATELRTRIAIDSKTGTVKSGALWFEENLPAESLLWGLYANNVRDQKRPNEQPEAAVAPNPFDPHLLLQLGGNGGVGRGLVRLLGLEEVKHA